MTNSSELDKSMRRLSNDICLSESVVGAVMRRLYERSNEVVLPEVKTGPAHLKRWRWMAATAVTLVFAAMLIGPLQIGSKDGGTWIGSSTAYAQALAETIAKRFANGITAREAIEYVMNDGTRHTSQTEGKYFVSQDGYRRDQFEGTSLQSRQWYVKHGKTMVETGVRFDTKTYTVLKHKGTFGELDPIERMQQLVKLIEKSGINLGSRTIDGFQCTGFEISASLYGDNPVTWIDRIWFDIKTKLPVRIERERPATHPDILFTVSIQDQFNWKPELPLNSFSPTIPEGFLQAE